MRISSADRSRSGARKTFLRVDAPLNSCNIILDEVYVLLQLNVSAWTAALRATCHMIGSIFLKPPTPLKPVSCAIPGDPVLSLPPSWIRPKAEKCSSPSTNCLWNELTDLLIWLVRHPVVVAIDMRGSFPFLLSLYQVLCAFLNCPSGRPAGARGHITIVIIFPSLNISSSV